VNTQALAVTGIRQRVVRRLGGHGERTRSPSRPALNGARAELVWLAQSDVPPCELAAHEAADRGTLEEASGGAALQLLVVRRRRDHLEQLEDPRASCPGPSPDARADLRPR
jgi:hypothetical protein